MQLNKGALKSWLRTKIEALSITDLTPLYKYIVVLVTKEKPENELKIFCVEQLEELLGDKTRDFVEEMFSVAFSSSNVSDYVSPEKSHFDDCSHRRMQGTFSPSSQSTRSNSPEKPIKCHRFHSPADTLCDSNNVRVNSISSNNRRPHNQNPSDSRKPHETHEYNPEDFNDRSASRYRSKTDHSDQEDSETHKVRPLQRSKRSRERGFRTEGSRSGRSEDSESNRPQRRRCRNFDERGFCIYGDRCRYEHGSDALVIPGTTAVAWTAANLFDSALAANSTCLLPTSTSNRACGNDSVLASSAEQEDIDAGGLPIYNPTPIAEALTRKPTHPFRPRSGAVNNKNIIAIPTDNNIYEPTPPAYEPARPEIADEYATAPMHQQPVNRESKLTNSTGIASIVANATDYTPSPISHQQQQCSLLVTKLPWRLNDSHRLREHFARFGGIVNIQTHFDGQGSQALVTYASAAECEAAYRSPEPILSNRFIRLSLWPPSNLSNGGGSAVGRSMGGGRFRGSTNRRHIDALGFSQFGRSLLGDAQPILHRLPAKFRLGRVEESKNALKRGHPASSTIVSASKPSSNKRSRWRLERDENGNPVSGGEDDEDEDEEEDVEAVENDKEANFNGENDDETARKRIRSSDFDDLDDILARNRNSRNSNSSLDEEASELTVPTALQRKKALWEHQKSTALKEHQMKLAQFERHKAARQQIETEKKSLIFQLSSELKETVAALDTVSNADTKQTLLMKARNLCKRLDDLKKSRFPTRRGEDIKRQNAVQQLLPNSVAAERLEKIAEVKHQLAQMEISLQTTASVESQAEIRKKIVDFKRKLVDLETIKAKDLTAINATTSLSNRSQTKLDKRPRVLCVSGLSTYDVEDFRQALAMNYLYTESFRPFTLGDDKQPVIEITFCTRDFAEAAVRTFLQFHGRPLVMSFAPSASMTKGLQQQQRQKGEDDEVEKKLSAPVVDATVGDEFRSPKLEAFSSP